MKSKLLNLKFQISNIRNGFIRIKTFLRNGFGFTLIELLVVIAVLGVLATGLMVLINPLGQTAKARDAVRKSDIKQIDSALNDYYLQAGKFPQEDTCDSSRGSKNSSCPILDADPQYVGKWEESAANNFFFNSLVTAFGIVKKLPIDPINDTTYYYRYEPSEAVGDSYCGSGTPCDYYWIGARLESLDDTGGVWVYRCSNDKTNSGIVANGFGCKEIKYPNGVSFDTAQR